MKRKQTPIITLIFLILSLSLTLIACNNKKAIVEIDKTKLTLDDFLYDIYLIELERDIWNNKYKQSLGMDYWEYDFDGMTMEQLAKDTIMTNVILYEILSDQANRAGYSLDKDELAAIEVKVDKLKSSISEDALKVSGMNRDILLKAFTRLALGDKYYQAVMSTYVLDEASIQSNIDPNEYREYKTECIYVPTSELVGQNIISLGEGELENAYDKIMEIKKLVLEGSSFDEVLAQIDGAIHYNRSFILSDNTAEHEYKEAAQELKKDEYSDVITTEFGHYIIHMVDDSSLDRYNKAIQDAIQDEKTSMFWMHYDELLGYYDITINKDYWESLELESLFPDLSYSQD